MVNIVHQKQNKAIDNFSKALVIKLRLVQENQLAYYILSIKKAPLILARATTNTSYLSAIHPAVL